MSETGGDNCSDCGADCGAEWRLMCEPVAHVEPVAGKTLRLCHNCHRGRLDQERTARRSATSREVGGRDPVPVVE